MPIIVAIDQYAEAALGSREFFWNKLRIEARTPLRAIKGLLPSSIFLVGRSKVAITLAPEYVLTDGQAKPLLLIVKYPDQAAVHERI